MALAELIQEINSLSIKPKVDERMSQFKELGQKGNKEWFSELSFCVLTANATAEKGIELQKKIGNGFLTLSAKKLKEKLKANGCRFPGRAEYIVYNRKFSNLKDILVKYETDSQAREWLVNNAKGIGYKEASHFLRNVGYTNLAILDRHILKILLKFNLIQAIPKTLTPNRYLEIEKSLISLSKKTGLSMGELDLYLWYMQTGKILK